MLFLKNSEDKNKEYMEIRSLILKTKKGRVENKIKAIPLISKA